MPTACPCWMLFKTYPCPSPYSYETKYTSMFGSYIFPVIQRFNVATSTARHTWYSFWRQGSHLSPPGKKSYFLHSSLTTAKQPDGHCYILYSIVLFFSPLLAEEETNAFRQWHGNSIRIANSPFTISLLLFSFLLFLNVNEMKLLFSNFFFWLSFPWRSFSPHPHPTYWIPFGTKKKKRITNDRTDISSDKQCE